MRPNRTVGLQTVTWRCNWNCKHCFFRRFQELHTNQDTPLDQLKKEIHAGKRRGCHAVTLTGKGEPMLYGRIEELISYIASIGMKPLMITNGSVGIEKYRRLYDLGLNHLQVSMHGLGETLDAISEVKGAGKRQMELLEWLGANNHPFRVTLTLQQLNYQEIHNIAIKAVQLGAFHISFLNFLPHYHWKHHVKEVTVDPGLLVEPLEETMGWLEKQKTPFTLRYFPMCMIKPRFWKYITNALYVLYDPQEWDYGHYSKDLNKVWESSRQSMRVTGIEGEPCASCLLKEHCGGWNRFYAKAFDFKGLRAIKEIPDEYKGVINRRGGLFDLNPANLLKGYAE